MALTFTGATGTSSATIPTHAAGDLIVAFAFRDGSNTAPALPTGQNWTDLGTSGANTCAVRMAKKTATSASEGTGTFTNATNFIVTVVKTDISGGSVVLNAPTLKTGATTTVSSDSRSIENPHGSSRMLSWLGSRSAPAGVTLDDYVPSNYTRISRNNPASNFAVSFRSDATVTTYGGWSTNSEEALGWISANAEVYDYDPSASGVTDPSVSNVGGTTATVGASTTSTATTLYVVVTTSATQPSLAQIQAGQDHLGNAAAYAANDATPSSGVNTFSATGLTVDTAYYAHFSQGTSRVSSTVFTTLDYPVLSNGATVTLLQTSAQISVDTDTAAGDIYGVVTESITAPSAAQINSGLDHLGNAAVATAESGEDPVDLGANTFTFTGLDSGTQYYAHFTQYTWDYSNVVTVAFETVVINPGVVVTLRDTDTDALLNAVTFSVVKIYDPADRTNAMATLSTQTTSASGVLTLDPSSFTEQMLADTVDIVGWNADGSIRFHASGTIVDLNE